MDRNKYFVKSTVAALIRKALRPGVAAIKAERHGGILLVVHVQDNHVFRAVLERSVPVICPDDGDHFVDDVVILEVTLERREPVLRFTDRHAVSK